MMTECEHQLLIAGHEELLLDRKEQLALRDRQHVWPDVLEKDEKRVDRGLGIVMRWLRANVRAVVWALWNNDVYRAVLRIGSHPDRRLDDLLWLIGARR